jgi:Large ribosomal RNA subunit accumulation protein YceD
MTPEFSRSLETGRVGPQGLDIEVVAQADERARLAARFGLPAIDALSCAFRLRPGLGGTITAEGTLRARVTQVCVVSTDQFEAVVSEDFVLCFAPEAEIPDHIDPDDPVDTVPLVGGQIDLGEAAAEQLALALDPYPRKPGATPPEFADAGPASPFAALERLKGRH